MMNRRDALKVMAAGGVAAALQPWEILAAQKRPNILWLSCEDISARIGCYGDPHAKTPHIDRLATEGVRYTNAYTVHGVCAPSRSGIITGMYPSTLGSNHMRCSAPLPTWVRGFPHYLRQAGYHCTNNAKTDYNARIPMDMWNESGKNAHYRNRPDGAPFFAVYNMTSTHESQTRAEAERHAHNTRSLKPGDRQDPDALVLPPYYADTSPTRKDLAQQYELITVLDYWVAQKLRELDEAGLTDDTIVFFWSDHGDGLPRAKRWLYDSGTRVPLIVRIPEKYRSGLQGRPDTVDDALVSFIDLGPTVLNMAGVRAPDHMQGRAFLGPRTGSPRSYVYGARDRVDERYDIIRSVRDKRYRYIRNYEPFKPYYQWVSYAERTPTMRELRRLHEAGELPQAAERFMADIKPVEELYDLELDPHEIMNFAAHPDYEDVLARMRAAHVAWMIETRDTGLLPEADLDQSGRELGSRHAVLHREGGDQLAKRLLEVASVASWPGHEDRDLLLEASRDPDAAIRYWAVTGIGLLDRHAKGGCEVAKDMIDDPSSVVRVAAARAMCLNGRDSGTIALPALAKELASGPGFARVLAANVIDDLGESARPILPALRKAMRDRNGNVKRVVTRTMEVLGSR